MCAQKGVPNSRERGNTDTRQVYAWIIANPTSGHGKGKTMIKNIEKNLRIGFGDGIVRFQKAQDILHRAFLDVGSNSPSPDTSHSSNSISSSAKSDTLSHRIRRGGLRVDLISTEEHIRGRQIAEHLAYLVALARMDPKSHPPASAALHLFIPVGGDGTLSEVVNGMCRGTLRAFRETFPHVMEETKGTKGASQEVNGSTGGDVRDASSARYWTFIQEKTILQNLMPPLIYLPAGTGCDFAKLRLCCRHEEDLLVVLRGVCAQILTCAPNRFFTHFPSSSSSSSAPMWHGERDATSCPSTKVERNDATTSIPIHANGEKVGLTGDMEGKPLGFVVFDVDLNRLTFPRTGNDCFFINESSCGMSCDVIRRCEDYKKNKLLSLTGGMIMFALASIVSVTQMRPKPFRIMPLPNTAPLPTEMLEETRCCAAPLLPAHSVSADLALQRAQQDLRCIAESVRDASIPPNDPLAIGANYYQYYEPPTRHIDSNGSGGSESKRSTTESALNAFYAIDHSRLREAKKRKEITAALDECAVNQPHGCWLCFPSSTLVFGNGRWFGGGLKITPHADPTDGQLSVTNWVAGFFSFVLRAPSLYNGKHAKWSTTTTWNTARCVVDVDRRDGKNSGQKKREKRKEDLMALCETDGELKEHLPAVVEVCGTVKIIVPMRRLEKRNVHPKDSKCHTLWKRFTARLLRCTRSDASESKGDSQEKQA